jgi:NADH-quinone oxidoreductase subunit J
VVELFVFAVAGGVCLAGAVGVVTNSNPVHAALSLVATLFGVAVLFVAQEAHFLAAVQVIVYAGAIVVLFLFVLMLLGVDQAEDLTVEPLAGQRIAAAVVGLAVFALPVVAVLSVEGATTGVPAAEGAVNSLGQGVADVALIGRSLFGRYLLAFEITAVLLVIAVVGAVVMAKRPPAGGDVEDPLVVAAEAEQAERQARENLDAAEDEETVRP